MNWHSDLRPRWSIYEQAVVKRETGTLKGIVPSIYPASAAWPCHLMNSMPAAIHSVEVCLGLSSKIGVRQFIPLQHLVSDSTPRCSFRFTDPLSTRTHQKTMPSLRVWCLPEGRALNRQTRYSAAVLFCSRAARSRRSAASRPSPAPGNVPWPPVRSSAALDHRAAPARKSRGSSGCV